MTEQALQARREYKRQWNRRNADKVKAAQARYWERKAAEAEAAQDQRTDEQAGQEAFYDTRTVNRGQRERADGQRACAAL